MYNVRARVIEYRSSTVEYPADSRGLWVRIPPGNTTQNSRACSSVLGERRVGIAEVRRFDPGQVHHQYPTALWANLGKVACLRSKSFVGSNPTRVTKDTRSNPLEIRLRALAGFEARNPAKAGSCLVSIPSEPHGRGIRLLTGRCESTDRVQLPSSEPSLGGLQLVRDDTAVNAPTP